MKLALKEAKKTGLHLPIVYNTSGYENIETIKWAYYEDNGLTCTIRE